jgi:anti-sigma B factor antagonist
MADSALTILERSVGDVTVLVLTGQVLVDDGDLAFGQRIRDLIDKGCLKIIVDLGGVTYIDSSGVGMMVAKLRSVRDHGGDMRLLHITARGQRLLKVMRILTTFETFDDEAAAVRSFASRPHS